MNPAFFQVQMQRLITRFGTKNFDPEFVKLVWGEVREMSEQGFQRFCDVLIGSRTATRPPLLSEFREAKLVEDKRRFENDLRGATRNLNRQAPEEMRQHLRRILSSEFGAVDSVSDALEIASLRAKVSGDGMGNG